jgi:hypothetical protein
VYDNNPIAICNLRPGSYTLFVYGYCDYDGETWASQWYDGADSLAAATWIDLAEGQLAPITVRLVTGASIEGRVLTAEGQETYSSVKVFDARGVPLCGNSGYSYGYGPFSFRGLNNGDYKLAARVSQEFEWWYPGTVDPDSASVIEIRDRQSITGIEWRLPPIAAAGPP